MFRFFELTESEQQAATNDRIEADRSDTFWAEGVTEMVREAMEVPGISDCAVDGLPETRVMDSYTAAMLQAYTYMHKLVEVCHG